MLSRLSALQSDYQRENNRLEKALVSNASLEVINSTNFMIQTLKTEIERLKLLVDKHINNTEKLKQDRDLLLTIPAIGEVLSRELLALFHSKKFETASQVSAFLGVVPKHWESGTLKGRATMSKNGSGRMRALLYMGAIVAIKYNPDVKALYERLVNAGKPKMKALCAAMKKLVQICFGVLKHQSEYRSQVV